MRRVLALLALTGCAAESPAAPVYPQVPAPAPPSCPPTITGADGNWVERSSGTDTVTIRAGHTLGLPGRRVELEIVAVPETPAGTLRVASTAASAELSGCTRLALVADGTELPLEGARTQVDEHGMNTAAPLPRETLERATEAGELHLRVCEAELAVPHEHLASWRALAWRWRHDAGNSDHWPVTFVRPTPEATAAGGAPGADYGGSGGTVHVNGYYRSNGTYVAPYSRGAPGHGRH